MNLEVIAPKLDALAGKIQAERGSLELLGLFLREDSPDLWDLVISAPWLEADKRAAFEYVAHELQEDLAGEELAGLSRIVILRHVGGVPDSFLAQFANRTGLIDGHFVTDGGAIIRRAYIVVAQIGSHRPGQRTTKKPPRTRVGSRGRFPSPQKSPRKRPAVP